MKIWKHSVYATCAAALTLTARACDLCGCYTPQLETLSAPGLADAGRSWTSGLYGAVAEQFTYFNTVQIDGREVRNPAGQHLDSSITQLVGGYTLNSWFSLT